MSLPPANKYLLKEELQTPSCWNLAFSLHQFQIAETSEWTRCSLALHTCFSVLLPQQVIFSDLGLLQAVFTGHPDSPASPPVSYTIPDLPFPWKAVCNFPRVCFCWLYVCLSSCPMKLWVPWRLRWTNLYLTPEALLRDKVITLHLLAKVHTGTHKRSRVTQLTWGPSSHPNTKLLRCLMTRFWPAFTASSPAAPLPPPEAVFTTRGSHGDYSPWTCMSHWGCSACSLAFHTHSPPEQLTHLPEAPWVHSVKLPQTVQPFVSRVLLDSAYSSALRALEWGILRFGICFPLKPKLAKQTRPTSKIFAICRSSLTSNGLWMAQGSNGEPVLEPKRVLSLKCS